MKKLLIIYVIKLYIMANSGNTKNLRYPTDPLEDLFETSKGNLDIDGMEDVYEIDIDGLNQESNTMATGQVSNLLVLYNNKEFCEQHPAFKKRIDTEIEALRIQYKIIKFNETMLDHLAVTIANKPDNASLYAAVDRLEGKLQSATEKVKQILNEFNKLCTSYQTEINFAIENQAQESSGDNADGSHTSRGRKAFIEQMNAEPEEGLFEDESEDDDELLKDEDTE